MATPAWQISGQYYETCSCDFVCPCVPGQMAVKPTKGSCSFAMGFQIERGAFGNVTVDGLGFTQPAAVKREGTRVTQSGKLENGQSLKKYLKQHFTTLISFRNANGAVTSVRYQNLMFEPN